MLVDGRPDAGRGKRLEAGYVIVSPSFFDTVGVPLRRGRAFDARDGGKGAEVAIVNERFVARHFPGADPIGRRIRMPDEDPDDDTGVARRSSASARTSATATRATATCRTSSTCRSSRSARAAPR